MKVQLPNKSANCRAYGLEFDCEGVADVKAEIVQSLLDASAVIEIKPVEKSKK